MMSHRQRYQSGGTVELGDIIIYVGVKGEVTHIFHPKTQQAKNHACFETGGIMIDLVDGDCYVLDVAAEEEDLELLGRRDQVE